MYKHNELSVTKENQDNRREVRVSIELDDSFVEIEDASNQCALCAICQRTSAKSTNSKDISIFILAKKVVPSVRLYVIQTKSSRNMHQKLTNHTVLCARIVASIIIQNILFDDTELLSTT
jgi:hypothetical protein